MVNSLNTFRWWLIVSYVLLYFPMIYKIILWSEHPATEYILLRQITVWYLWYEFLSVLMTGSKSAHRHTSCLTCGSGRDNFLPRQNFKILPWTLILFQKKISWIFICSKNYLTFIGIFRKPPSVTYPSKHTACT